MVRHFGFGDCLLITPFIRQIKTTLPECCIDVFSHMDFFQYYPEVNRWIDSRKISLQTIVNRYERVYYFIYEHSPMQHLLDGYEYSSGIRLKDDRPFVPTKLETGTDALSKYGLQKKKYLLLCPFAGPGARGLDTERVGRICGTLRQCFPELQLVIIHDKPRYFPKAINITGRLSFPTLIQIMTGALACITVDTSFWHLAQACNTPSLVFTGPTDPALRVSNPGKTLALSAELSCLGCYHRHIGTFALRFTHCFWGDYRCMKDLPLEKIVTAIQDIRAGKKFKPMRSLRRSKERLHEFEKTRNAGELNPENVIRFYAAIIEKERRARYSFHGLPRRFARLMVDRLKPAIRLLSRILQFSTNFRYGLTKP